MPSEKLPRRLGPWRSVAVVIGISIGSGIFRTPARIAQLAPHPAWMLGLWLAGGLIAFCGALSLAELGAALPETGGYYAYLREGWGRLAAFLFGWAQLTVLRATALGGVALVFGEYALRAAGVDPVTHPAAARGLSAAAIALAAAANIVGVDVGAAIVTASTMAKLSSLGVLVLASLLFGGRHGASLSHFMAPDPVATGGLGLALISVLWTYDGFGDLAFVGGEVEDPQRNIPRAVIFSTVTLAAAYLLANVAYLYVLPIDRIARSPLVAGDTMAALFGQTGVTLVSALVAVSTFSSLNGIMLASPRVFFAMAADGLLWTPIARVHPRFKTPYVAILLAASLGALLVVIQTFEALTTAFVLAIWPFYALSVASIYRLRHRRPSLPRPYSVTGYPIVPAVFIAAVSWFVINALVSDPRPTAVTFALILAGIPVYWAAFGRRRREARASDQRT